jgi:putative ABC transport system permease protein
VVNDSDRIDYINADVISGEEPADVAERIRQELRRERNVAEGEENFSVSTSDDLIELFLGILNTVQYVVIGIVSIALLVGGLGIMNTMYMAVSERTKEIGIMKAVGATKKQILTIYLVESGILGLIGGVIGTLLGLGISEVGFYFIRQFAGIPLYPNRSLMLVGGSLLASFFLGVFSGFLPARKAAELEPVEAIRKG